MTQLNRIVSATKTPYKNDAYSVRHTSTNLDDITITSWDPQLTQYTDSLEQALNNAMQVEITKNPHFRNGSITRHISTDIRDNDAYIELGTLQFRDIKFMAQIAPDIRRIKARYFGSNTITMIEDDNNDKYFIFCSRNPNIHHHKSGSEVESVPKGMHNLGLYNDHAMLANILQGTSSRVLRNIVEAQGRAQLRLPQGVQTQAVVPLGTFSIQDPHNEDGIMYFQHLKIPTLIDDATNFGDGNKYLGSLHIPQKEMADFVEQRGETIMPLARAMIYQLTQKEDGRYLFE